MKNLIYLVLTTLMAQVLGMVIKWLLEHLLPKVYRWIKRYGYLLASLADFLRRGPLGTFLWLLGLLTVLYVFTFIVFVFVGGAPTVDVPEQDIYVPDGQQGEARILVEDASFRGVLFRNFFPPASLMKVKVTAKQGRLTILDGDSPEPSDELVVRVHQGEVVVVRYSFAEGYTTGDVQVSIFGLFANVQKDASAEIKTIRFVKTTP